MLSDEELSIFEKSVRDYGIGYTVRYDTQLLVLIAQAREANRLRRENAALLEKARLCDEMALIFKDALGDDERFKELSIAGTAGWVANDWLARYTAATACREEGE